MRFKKLIQFLLGLSILYFTNCQTAELTEPTIQDQQNKQNLPIRLDENPFKSSYVSIDQIPRIKEFLISKSSKSYFENKSSLDEIVSVIKDSVIVILDDNGNANYTFQFFYRDGLPNTIYNLIVEQHTDGSINEPFVLSYTLDPSSQDEFVNLDLYGDLDFSKFDGSLNVHPFEYFFPDGQFANKDECIDYDSNGDPINCEQILIDSGAASGGSGLSQGGPDNPGWDPYTGYSGTFSMAVYHQTPNDGTYLFSSGSVCQHPGECTIILVRTSQADQKVRTTAVSTTECEDCEVFNSSGFGINYHSAVGALGFKLQLDTTRKVYLNQYPQFAIQLNDYLIDNNHSQVSMDFVREVIETSMAKNIKDLGEYFVYLEVINNPFQLLEIDCSQIQQWQALASFNPPQSVLNKLEDINQNKPLLLGDFEVQHIEEAEGTVVNLDYFPIEISQLPNNPNSGQQFTADGFLEYIRKNINDFINTTQTEFTPYNFFDTGYNEFNIWNSSNALGALIHLDINVTGTILSNDGTVVCAGHTNSKWNFTTIRAPGDYDHPVSGNREFGYTYNAGSGKYTFYTRGVDRVTESIDQELAEFFGIQEPFQGGDDLWTSFQNGVESFVNSNGGSGTKKQSVSNRPDWEEVEEVLLGNRPVSDLGCN